MELRGLLAKGLPDLDTSALTRVQQHLAQLGREGEAWVGQGMSFAHHLATQGHQECPFCAQDLRGSPLLAHYRAYFGEAYNELKREIADAFRAFRLAQGGDVPVAFERSIRETMERQGVLEGFCRYSRCRSGYGCNRSNLEVGPGAD
jgi:hypothetical protein